MAEKNECSFCGAVESDEVILFRGDNCFICDSCVEFIYNMIKDHKIDFSNDQSNYSKAVDDLSFFFVSMCVMIFHGAKLLLQTPTK